MRIVFVTQWFDPEPGAMRGLPLARWLIGRGHDVRVITGFPNYPGGKLYPGYSVKWRQWERMDGVPVLRVALYPNHSQSALGRILNFGSFALSSATLGNALIGPADVAYIYHPPATVGLAGMTLKAFRGLPYVYHIADMWPESVVESGMLGHGVLKRVLTPAIGAWCKLMYRGASRITVLSEGFRDLLESRGVPRDKVEVIYNWTEEEVFRPMTRDEALAAELGLAGTFNVVYAGNLGAFPALDTVIRAAARLREHSDIRIVIAGTGQKEGELKELARSLDTKNVVFLGYRPFTDMPRINALADVLLVHLKDLPFFATTIPSKTQVSLASGRPVLMAVAGEAAAIIERARAGITAPPENEAALAEAILRMRAMTAEEREAMGRNGFDYYKREMSLETGGTRMEEIFREIVESRKARR
jgi:glycosyltransferase involved in cell wall biosynthesis